MNIVPVMAISVEVVDVSEVTCNVKICGRITLIFSNTEKGPWKQAKLGRGFVPNRFFSEARRQATYAFLSFQNREKSEGFGDLSDLEILQCFLEEKPKKHSRKVLDQWLADHGLWTTNREVHILHLLDRPVRKSCATQQGRLPLN